MIREYREGFKKREGEEGKFKWVEVGNLFEILINSVKYPIENFPFCKYQGKEKNTGRLKLKRGTKEEG